MAGETRPGCKTSVIAAPAPIAGVGQWRAALVLAHAAAVSHCGTARRSRVGRHRLAAKGVRTTEGGRIRLRNERCFVAREPGAGYEKPASGFGALPDAIWST